MRFAIPGALRIMTTNGPARILYLNPTSAMSGAEFSLLALMAALDRERFVPWLVLPEEGRFAAAARAAGIETGRVAALPPFGAARSLRTALRTARAARRLARLIRERGVRLVHANAPRAGYAAGLAARLAGVPSVIHVRDIHLSPFGGRTRARVLGRLADAVVAVSGAAAAAVTSVTPTLAPKVRVIPNGLDLAAFSDRPRRDVRAELGIGPTDPVLAAAGVLHPAKGIDVFLRAAARLKPGRPRLRALVIGAPLTPADAAHARDLETLAAEIGLGAAAVFTGFREDALDLIAAADVLVHPAVYPDPLPRVVLEGLALRRPVVAARVGGVPEIIEDGVHGRLVPPADPSAMAEAIAALLDDPAAARALAERGRRRVEREFTIEKHAAAVTELYSFLMSAT